ncbi:MAG: hypothetical protein QF599_10815 [Planctomycetota bacterium]|nr:hypothetical protein [Planctomycetota bacterium]MDP6956456.1 hypothetical protein [Planctomycetota bacterium]
MFQITRPPMVLLRTQSRARPLLLPLLLLLPLSCQAATGSQSLFNSELDLMIARGQFDEAVRLAASAVEADPADLTAQADHRRATVAWHLEQGRRATFAGADEEALASFARAQEIEPGSELVANWIDKTRRKVRQSLLGQAAEALANENLEAALMAYGGILAEEPDNGDAQAGLERVLSEMEQRGDLADDYYRDGINALADLWLEQARARFAYSNKYRAGDERTEMRTGEVDQLLAGQRLALGADLEQRGLYHAASFEYGLAAELDGSLGAARAGISRMAVETVVARRLETARMNILRGEFEKAQGTLEELSGETALQGEAIAGLLDEVDARRMESRYQTALSLERDKRFVAARDAYAALLADASYYSDARARHAALVDYIERAARLYSEAQETSNSAERAALLGQIAFFWPGYRDVRSQLAALRAQQP